MIRQVALLLCVAFGKLLFTTEIINQWVTKCNKWFSFSFYSIGSRFIGLLIAGPPSSKSIFWFLQRRMAFFSFREVLISGQFNRLNAGRSFRTSRSPSTAPTALSGSTPTRNSNACCSICATKTAAAYLICAVLEQLSTSSTAFAIGFTILTARKPTNGKIWPPSI